MQVITIQVSKLANFGHNNRHILPEQNINQIQAQALVQAQTSQI